MRTTILTLLLAALAFPGTAAAQKIDIEGPLTLKGHGPLRGELQMANPSETRSVVFGGQGGFVRFIDVAGDLRVQCKGRGRSSARENEAGQKVYTCMGRGGRARVHGSHFKLVAFAMNYGIRIPEGVTGSLQGRFRARDGQSDDPQADRADRLKDRAEKLKDRREKMKERAEKLKDKVKDKKQGDEPEPLPEEEEAPTDEEIDEAIDEAGGDE